MKLSLNSGWVLPRLSNGGFSRPMCPSRTLYVRSKNLWRAWRRISYHMVRRWTPYSLRLATTRGRRKHHRALRINSKIIFLSICSWIVGILWVAVDKPETVLQWLTTCPAEGARAPPTRVPPDIGSILMMQTKRALLCSGQFYETTLHTSPFVNFFDSKKAHKNVALGSEGFSTQKK